MDEVLEAAKSVLDIALHKNANPVKGNARKRKKPSTPITGSSQASSVINTANADDIQNNSENIPEGNSFAATQNPSKPVAREEGSLLRDKNTLALANNSAVAGDVVVPDVNFITVLSTHNTLQNKLMEDLAKLTSTADDLTNFNNLSKARITTKKYQDSVDNFLKQVHATIDKYEEIVTQSFLKSKLNDFIQGLSPAIFLPIQGIPQGKDKYPVLHSVYNLVKVKVMFPFMRSLLNLGDYVDEKSFIEEITSFIAYDFELDADGNILFIEEDSSLSPHELSNVKFLRAMYGIYLSSKNGFKEYAENSYALFMSPNDDNDAFTPAIYLKSWLKNVDDLNPDNRSNYKKSKILPNYADVFNFIVCNNTVTFFHVGNKLRRVHRETILKVW